MTALLVFCCAKHFLRLSDSSFLLKYMNSRAAIIRTTGYIQTGIRIPLDGDVTGSTEESELTCDSSSLPVLSELVAEGTLLVWEEVLGALVLLEEELLVVPGF